MNHQDSMFGGAEIADIPEARALARRNDPGTSKEAAKGVAQFAGNHYDKIMAAMKVLAKPVGAEQISAALLRGGVKLEPYQIRKRLSDLEKKNIVAVSQDVLDGKVMDETRETSSGKHERLWVIVEAR